MTLFKTSKPKLFRLSWGFAFFPTNLGDRYIWLEAYYKIEKRGYNGFYSTCSRSKSIFGLRKKHKTYYINKYKKTKEEELNLMRWNKLLNLKAKNFDELQKALEDKARSSK